MLKAHKAKKIWGLLMAKGAAGKKFSDFFTV